MPSAGCPGELETYSILCDGIICYRSIPRATADSERILCRIVEIVGNKEKPKYKLRCLYGLLKGLHPTSALATCAVSTAIQQSQGNSIPINKTRNDITLAQATPQAPISNEACNCKKGSGTRRCRYYKNDLKCSQYSLRLWQIDAPHRAHRDIPSTGRAMDVFPLPRPASIHAITNPDVVVGLPDLPLPSHRKGSERKKEQKGGERKRNNLSGPRQSPLLLHLFSLY